VQKQDTSKVYISYSHDSSEHNDRVMALSDRLRSMDIDSRIDQYDPLPEEENKVLWPDQLENFSFILAICSNRYEKLFKTHTLKISEGGLESQYVKGKTFRAITGKNKIIPIAFSEEDLEYIPASLQKTQSYLVSDEKQFEALLLRLTSQDKPLDEPELQPSSTSNWIFQYVLKENPPKWAERVKKGKPEYWRVTRYKNDIKHGDTVYIWESGKDGGIRGKGRVELPGKMDGSTLRLPIYFTDFFDEVIPRENFKRFKGLENLSIFTAPQGTNFKVTKTQAVKLNRLIEKTTHIKGNSLPGVTLAKYTFGNDALTVMRAGISIIDNIRLNENILSNFSPKILLFSLTVSRQLNVDHMS
jgi:hypothetical protein